MKNSKRFIYLLAAGIFFLTSTSLRADLPPSEVQEINKFRLTEKNMAQFKQATKNLIAAAEQDQATFQNRDREESQKESLAAVVEATDKIPVAKKAINDAGMTTREYWLFEFALVYAGAGHLVMKAGQKLPEGYSKENVDFFVAHQAEFAKLQPDIEKLNKLTGEHSEDESEDTEEEQQ